jgi:hypothetical protein
VPVLGEAAGVQLAGVVALDRAGLARLPRAEDHGARRVGGQRAADRGVDADQQRVTGAARGEHALDDRQAVAERGAARRDVQRPGVEAEPLHDACGRVVRCLGRQHDQVHRADLR